MKYFNLVAILILSGVVGLMVWVGVNPHKDNSQKHYPVTVQCYWETKGYQSYPTFECDSIKGDTCYKDGNVIITKNIINVSFN
jgi:hypothetical protein